MSRLSYSMDSGNKFRNGRTHWIRYGSRVISLTNTDKLFSERNGFKNSLSIGFGWRLRYANDEVVR